MIGNDIIDLNISLTTSKAGNFRFLKKVFSPKEIECIHESECPNIMLWEFWSMKEAVYKAHQRITGTLRKLNPLAFECSLRSMENAGTVRVGKKFYYTKTEISPNYVHSWVDSAEILRKIYFNKIFSQEDLLRHLALKLSLEADMLRITKDPKNIPSLHIRGIDKIMPFSLSHHGHFTAFVIPLIKS